jgi:hypothetical protein
MTTRTFASHADVEEKKVSFERLSDHAYAYTAEGDPNTGIVIGDDAVMVVDTQATPVMAQDVIRRIREVTDEPIRYVVLSHYHAVRVLGASGYRPEHVIASRDTYDLIVERGEADMKSEIERFPRLFCQPEPVYHFTSRMRATPGSSLRPPAPEMPNRRGDDHGEEDDSLKREGEDRRKGDEPPRRFDPVGELRDGQASAEEDRREDDGQAIAMGGSHDWPSVLPFAGCD